MPRLRNALLFDSVVIAASAAITMPFAFSISHGIAFGLISYVGIKALSGRFKDLMPMVAIIAAVFVFKFAFL